MANNANIANPANTAGIPNMANSANIANLDEDLTCQLRPRTSASQSGSQSTCECLRSTVVERPVISY